MFLIYIERHTMIEIEKFEKCSQAEQKQIRTIFSLFHNEDLEIKNIQNLYEIARDSILMERDYCVKKSLERFPYVKIINDDPIKSSSHYDAQERFKKCSQAEQKVIKILFLILNTKKVKNMQKIYEIARDLSLLFKRIANAKSSSSI